MRRGTPSFCVLELLLKELTNIKVLCIAGVGLKQRIDFIDLALKSVQVHHRGQVERFTHCLLNCFR